ncbi:MAG: cupredoxin domain-containing protein [Candidatus Nitrosocosmicus sp.]
MMNNKSCATIFSIISILVLLTTLHCMEFNFVFAKEGILKPHYKLVSSDNTIAYGLNGTKSNNMNKTDNNGNFSVKSDTILSSITNIQMPGNTHPLSKNNSGPIVNDSSNQTQSNNHTTTSLPTTKKVIIVKGAALLRDKAYSPNPIIIHAQDSINWINSDDVVHTVTSGASFNSPDRGQAFDSGLLGGSYSHKFDKPGIYNYFCQIHPTMLGKIIVEK